MLALFCNILFVVVGMIYIKWYEGYLVKKGRGYAPAYGTGAASDEGGRMIPLKVRTGFCL